MGRQMKYVIMADGEGSRWHAQDGIPKHLMDVGGVTLLARTVGQLQELGAAAENIVITSHDPRYAIPGATLHVPLNNHREIDRFTRELIEDDMCFLYGDTYYSRPTMASIVKTPADGVLFTGSHLRIVAIKIGSAEQFRRGLALVEEAIGDGRLADGKGWQVYRALHGIPFGAREIRGDFSWADDLTRDINTWADYRHLLAAIGPGQSSPATP